MASIRYQMSQRWLELKLRTDILIIQVFLKPKWRASSERLQRKHRARTTRVVVANGAFAEAIGGAPQHVASEMAQKSFPFVLMPFV